MMTSIYASSITEDDGWVEGDNDSQGEISSQEELEDAYGGSRWEDNVGPNDFEETPVNDNNDDDSSPNDEKGWNDSCRDAGFNDGKNGPFNDGTYDHCGDETTGHKAYLDGFVDGCMSVEGNTRDVCESTTDG